MAKGQKRSNREAKKPKASKKPAPAATTSSRAGSANLPASKGRDK